MQQVIFTLFGFPFPAFGAMLFITFIVVTWWGTIRAKRVGMEPPRFQDFVVVIFVTGFVGARVLYMIQYAHHFPDQSFLGLAGAFFQVWEGGIVFYGSARIPSPEEAQARIDAATTDQARAVAERLAAKSHYYEVARELARIAAQYPVNADGCRNFVVCSGGGPSIMEAANRGAADVGAQTVGMNILLPHEQWPNRYVTPDLSFRFHYFALRKMHFLLRARAVAVFPGGFGTFDEAFELLTLIQTGKVKPMPILFFGRDYWNRVVNFEALVDEGVIAPADLDLFSFCETAEEAWAYVCRYYAGTDSSPGC